MVDISLAPIARTPHLFAPDIFDENVFDMGPIVRRPTFFAPFIADPTVVQPDIIARLYELPDLTNPIVDDLVSGRSRSWVNVLNDPGHGEIHFSLDSPELDDIIIGHIHVISFEYKGWRAADLLCEQKHTVTLAEGEEAQEEAVISGPLSLGMTMWGEIYPTLGVLREPVEDNRIFDWTSPVFPDGGWPLGLVLSSMTAAKAFPGTWWAIPWDIDDVFLGNPAIIGIPGTNTGQFGAPPGDWYYRQPFAVPATADYLVIGGADNMVDVSIDGVLTMSAGTSSADGWIHPAKQIVRLSAGIHLMAAHVTNKDLNPTGFAFEVDTMDAFGDPLAVVATSNSSAKVLAYPPGPPGMATGRVLNIIFDEYQLRGGLPDMVRSWTNDVDTNGNPWPVYAGVATRVGTKIGVTLRELCDTYCDLRWQPGGMTLDAYVKDGLGISRTVTLHGPTDPDDPDSSNLLHLEQDLDATESADALLLRADFGWAERVRSPSGTAYGRIENTFGVGAQQSLDEVYRIADGQLDIYQDPQEQITAAVAAASLADDAYFAYDVGDVIAGIPDSNGDVLAQRVISIAVSEDDNTGVATVVPTFKGIVYGAGERFSIDMAKTSAYTAGGTSRVAQPWTPEGKIKRIPQAAPAQPCRCIGRTLTDPGPWSVTDEGFDFRTVVDLCTADVRVAITVDAFAAVANNQIWVSARLGGGASYTFSATANTPPTDATWSLHTFSELATPIVTTLPQPNDTLELTVIGTSLVAKRNGATMFSVTDSEITVAGDAEFDIVSGGPGGIVEARDFTVETFCP